MTTKSVVTEEGHRLHCDKNQIKAVKAIHSNDTKCQLRGNLGSKRVRSEPTGFAFAYGRLFVIIAPTGQILLIQFKLIKPFAMEKPP